MSGLLVRKALNNNVTKVHIELKKTLHKLFEVPHVKKRTQDSNAALLFRQSWSALANELELLYTCPDVEESILERVGIPFAENVLCFPEIINVDDSHIPYLLYCSLSAVDHLRLKGESGKLFVYCIHIFNPAIDYATGSSLTTQIATLCGNIQRCQHLSEQVENES